MEATIRHLRDGRIRDQSGCSIALLCDDLDCAGGRDLLQQLVTDYMAAFAKGLCQANGVKLLMLEGSVCLTQQPPTVTVLDGCSDPAGWLRAAGVMPSHEAGFPQLITSTDSSALPTILASLVEPLQQLHGSSPAPQGDGHSTCVIIDNLTPLLMHHSAVKVLLFLEQLRNHPNVSCVLTAVHQDVVCPHAVSGLQRQASCCLQLQPVSNLHQDLLQQMTGQTAHGYVMCSFKSRKAGRLRTEGSFYSLSTATGISFIHAPPQFRDFTPEALVAISVRQAAASNPSGVAKPAADASQSSGAGAGTAAGAGAGAGAAVADGPGQEVAAGMGAKAPGLPMGHAGGMRLTLTEQERQAKEAVVLPYEHFGSGLAYQTGDWKDYLPAAAGGRSGLTHGQPQLAVPEGVDSQGSTTFQGSTLGHILYVRDSDDENGGLHDSDEDPDDDLDI